MNAAAYALPFLCVTVCVLGIARYVALGRSRRANLEPTAGKELLGLAEEYRRLSDMAVTSTEHVDLRLTDLTARVDELRDRLDQVQRTLKEAE